MKIVLNPLCINGFFFWLNQKFALESDDFWRFDKGMHVIWFCVHFVLVLCLKRLFICRVGFRGVEAEVGPEVQPIAEVT
jgi:hypothetical protein